MHLNLLLRPYFITTSYSTCSQINFILYIKKKEYAGFFNIFFDKKNTIIKNQKARTTWPINEKKIMVLHCGLGDSMIVFQVLSYEMI